MKKVAKKLTAARMKQVAAARKAALTTDRQDLVSQAKTAATISDVMKALKAAREHEGISLRELESRTGISRGNLSKLERGSSNPTIETLARYAKAIGRKLTVAVE